MTSSGPPASSSPSPALSSSAQPSSTLPSLTAARFFAALWVVAYHFGLERFGVAKGPLRAFVESGPMAVGFFFVLSGFVLTWSGLDDDGWPRRRPRAFIASRLKRLWPVHATATAIALLPAIVIAKRATENDGGAASAFVDEVVVDLVLNLSMLQAWVPGHELAINPPAWSLSAEFFFSLLIVPLMAPLARLKPTVAVLSLVCLWVLSVAPGIVYLLRDPDGLITTGVDVDHHAKGLWLGVLKYHPLVRAPEFVAGIVVAGVVRRHGALSVAVAVVAVVVGVVVFVVVGAMGLSVPINHNGLTLPAAIAIVVGLASLPTLGASRLLQQLGQSSFALYMVHVPLMYWAAGLTKRGDTSALDHAGGAAVVVLVCMAMATAVHTVVEGRRGQAHRPSS